MFSCDHRQKFTSPNLNNLDKVIFRYHDSSVAPEYHRSYSITATAENLALEVDSYGLILLDTLIAIGASDFRQIKQQVLRSDFYLCNHRENDGCTGGTSRSIQLEAQDSILLKGSVYLCGGQSFGDLCGEQLELHTLLLSFFNKALLDPPYPEED